MTASLRARANLLQQFQYELLLLVSLGQSGDARLFQNRVFGEVGHDGRNIGSRDGVFRRGQVLHLTVDDVAGRGEPVDACAQRAAYASHVGDGRIDQGQRGLRVALGVQVRGGQVYGLPAAAVGNSSRRQPANAHGDWPIR